MMNMSYMEQLNIVLFNFDLLFSFAINQDKETLTIRYH